MIDQPQEMNEIGTERDSLARGDVMMPRDRIPSATRSDFQKELGDSDAHSYVLRYAAFHDGDENKAAIYRATTRSSNFVPSARETQSHLPTSQFSQDISMQMRVSCFHQFLVRYDEPL